jgi:hypothetical protein
MVSLRETICFDETVQLEKSEQRKNEVEPARP